MNTIQVSLKNIYGKVVCKSDSIDTKFGQYPKIGWININGRYMKRRNIKYKIIKLEESPQYKFLCNNTNYYKEYMNITGWISGYGRERKNAVKNFENLIKNFDEKKMTQIDCVIEDGKYVLVDGLHRCSIMFYKNKDKLIKINIIKCKDFTSLPRK
jgi:hypothetical protein